MKVQGRVNNTLVAAPCHKKRQEEGDEEGGVSPVTSTSSKRQKSGLRETKNEGDGRPRRRETEFMIGSE